METEEERPQSAVQRIREALASELQLWEGYMQKVLKSHPQGTK